ncbi:MAG: glycerate kinase [Actinomycetota bacterium]
MRVLVAPDKFRGTLTADEAALALARGWLRARPADEVEELPLADGGEGTLDALVAALGGERRAITVTGPLGDPVEAAFGLLPGPSGVVEMALASGLALVPGGRGDPLRATTFGTGELILAACRAGARSVVVCIGGSATNDGGAGAAQALGFRLLDGDGRDLDVGGGALARLERIDASGVSPDVAGVRFVVASDVDNPLTGAAGAAAVYGPQKGASPRDVRALDAALDRLAAVVRRDVGADVAGRPGAGAAGGLGFGLMAFLGAELRPGIEVVMEAVRFDERLEGADAVVTGEGKFDQQSFHGKTVGGVLEAAARRHRPVAVVCGTAEASASEVPVVSLVELVGRDRAFHDAAGAAGEAAALLAGRLDWLPREAR